MDASQGTARDAQKFLNGIRALLGTDEYFYLISVSENAMSSFERRGLPIRDAFDSSFDKIVYLDYLDYQVSQRRLNPRGRRLCDPFAEIGRSQAQDNDCQAKNKVSCK